MWLALIFPILIGSSNAQVNKLLTQLNPVISRIIETECLGHTNLNLKKIDQIEQNIIKPDEKTREVLRCVPYCVFSKLHILDSEGRFYPYKNRNVFIHSAKSEEEITECIRENSDPCERALQFTACLLDDAGSNNIKNVDVETNADTNTANNLGLEDVTANVSIE